MRFVFLWLCAILFSGVVYGESDRDSLKVRLGAPRLNLGAPGVADGFYSGCIYRTIG